MDGKPDFLARFFGQHAEKFVAPIYFCPELKSMTQDRTIPLDEAVQLGLSHFNKGEFHASAAIFSNIVQTVPRHALSHQMLGLIAFRAGKKEEAVRAMTEAVRFQPKDAGFLANFTEILRSAGRVEQAIETGLKAVAISPGSAAAHSNLGLAYYDQGNLDQAEASQNRALALDPDFDRALNNLGSIARDKGDRKTAAELYRKTLSIQPGSAETVNNLLSVLIEDENLKEARAFAEAQLRHLPKDAELHRNFGRIFLLESDLDKAENAFRNAIALNRNKADSYIGLSQVLFEKNHPRLALVEAEQAIRLDPASAAAFHQHAIVTAHLGDTERAVSHYLKAVELKPDMTASRLALGYLELEQGNSEGARAHFERAAEMDGDKLNALIALSKLEKATPDGDVFTALQKKMPEATGMLPQKAVAFHFAMGECFEQLKDYDAAFHHFRTGAGLKRKLIDYDSDDLDRLTNTLIETFDARMINRLRVCANDSARPIFVVGMPRSGTTMTESILNAHSSVFGAGELNDLQHQFGKVGDQQTEVPETIAALSDADLKRRADNYVDVLRLLAPEAPYVVDKMPANFQLVGLIHGILPNAKIIHVARNPFDTCLSCYTRLFERSQLHSYDLVELGRYFNNYVRIMNHWRRTLPSDAFITVHYEHLVDDLEHESRRMIDHCGLEWDDACLSFHKSKRRVRTASVQQVRKPLYNSSKAKWRKYEQQLQPLIDIIGDNAIRF